MLGRGASLGLSQDFFYLFPFDFFFDSLVVQKCVVCEFSSFPVVIVLRFPFTEFGKALWYNVCVLEGTIPALTGPLACAEHVPRALERTVYDECLLVLLVVVLLKSAVSLLVLLLVHLAIIESGGLTSQLLVHCCLFLRVLWFVFALYI